MSQQPLTNSVTGQNGLHQTSLTSVFVCRTLPNFADTQKLWRLTFLRFHLWTQSHWTLWSFEAVCTNTIPPQDSQSLCFSLMNQKQTKKKRPGTNFLFHWFREETTFRQKNATTNRIMFVHEARPQEVKGGGQRRRVISAAGEAGPLVWDNVSRVGSNRNNVK